MPSTENPPKVSRPSAGSTAVSSSASGMEQFVDDPSTHNNVLRKRLFVTAARTRNTAMCGAKEIRTPDLFDANEALYQLSYSPWTSL